MNCPPRVREALTSLPWVRQAQVNYERKQAVVVVETERYDESAIVRALEQAGYEGKAVK